MTGSPIDGLKFWQKAVLIPFLAAWMAAEKVKDVFTRKK